MIQLIDINKIYLPKRSRTSSEVKLLNAMVISFDKPNCVILKRSGEQYKIVDGFLRVQAAKEVGLTTIEALIINDNPYQEWYNLFRESITKQDALCIAVDWLTDRDLEDGVFREYLRRLDMIDHGIKLDKPIDSKYQQAWIDATGIELKENKSAGWFGPVGPFHSISYTNDTNIGVLRHFQHCGKEIEPYYKDKIIRELAGYSSVFCPDNLQTLNMPKLQLLSLIQNGSYDRIRSCIEAFKSNDNLLPLCKLQILTQGNVQTFVRTLI